MSIFVCACVLYLLSFKIALVLAMVTYENPTYRYYKYSGYAVVAGWCIALVSVIPILVTMVVTIVKRKGSLFEVYLPSYYKS